MSVQSTELELLRTSLKGKLEDIEAIASMGKSDIITSLLDKTKELMEGVITLKEKQEICSMDVARMKEKMLHDEGNDNDINEKCQRKLDEIFRMQIEFESEKWKQEQLKCELFEELYQIENNAREVEQEMKEQLAYYEQLEENRQKENSYVSEVEKQVSSLLNKMDEKEEEIEKYKSSLAVALKELSLLTDQFQVKNDETPRKVKVTSCTERKIDAVTQCSILSSKEDKFTETELMNLKEEKKNAEIQCSIFNANVGKSDTEDLQKELDEVYEKSEKLFDELYREKDKRKYFQVKVKYLQDELNEMEGIKNGQKNNKSEISIQTDEAETKENSRLSEDAFAQLQRNLGKQKLVVVDLKNQLAEERKNIKVSREENEFLSQKIQQMKLYIRRLQQPPEATVVIEQVKEKLNPSKKDAAELYERGGSGIVKSVKLDMMENQVRFLKKQVKKLEKENCILKSKRNSTDFKVMEINKEETENRVKPDSSLTQSRIQYTDNLSEKEENISSNPLKAITNNISSNSAKDFFEENSALHHQPNYLGLSQDCHVQ